MTASSKVCHKRVRGKRPLHYSCTSPRLKHRPWVMTMQLSAAEESMWQSHKTCAHQGHVLLYMCHRICNRTASDCIATRATHWLAQCHHTGLKRVPFMGSSGFASAGKHLSCLQQKPDFLPVHNPAQPSIAMALANADAAQALPGTPTWLAQALNHGHAEARTCGRRDS